MPARDAPRAIMQRLTVEERQTPQVVQVRGNADWSSFDHPAIGDGARRGGAPGAEGLWRLLSHSRLTLQRGMEAFPAGDVTASWDSRQLRLGFAGSWPPDDGEAGRVAGAGSKNRLRIRRDPRHQMILLRMPSPDAEVTGEGNRCGEGAPVQTCRRGARPQRGRAGCSPGGHRVAHPARAARGRSLR